MPRVSGLSDLFDQRLPINRKERYYTGTVLPMIVASDGFKHFGRFLALCGMPEVALLADPNSSNVQFLTEYGFEESLRDGAEERFCDPGGRDTPDLVVYVESEQSLLLGIEAKFFSRPSIADVRKQLDKQAQLLSIMANGVETQPLVQQVALLPAGLWDPMPEWINDDVPVLTWQQVAHDFRSVAPPYWIGVLDEALRRYDNLVSTTGSGQNRDAKILGQKILEDYSQGELKYKWMGREQGLNGQNLQHDISTGKWRTYEYEVRYDPLCGKRNWFPIADFIEKIKRKRIGTQLTAVIERQGDGYVALCPQLDIASQGDSVALAREKLKEALELFFETAGSEEVSRRLSGEV